MRDFRKIKAWQKAHDLTLAVYSASKAFPPDERFSLTSQLRRAAASIPTNIAEGAGRDGDAELARFLVIAFGSANETEYLMLLAKDLGYLQSDEYEPLTKLTQEVKRMLTPFINKLKADR
ncbi:MAG: four helix bundle protein [Rhodospirillales bacterium]|nr:four helix bundle protein [Rhodospirillales bacterium]